MRTASPGDYPVAWKATAAVAILAFYTVHDLEGCRSPDLDHSLENPQLDRLRLV